jgi:hypothetical protein
VKGALIVWEAPLLSVTINCPEVGGSVKVIVPDTE